MSLIQKSKRHPSPSIEKVSGQLERMLSSPDFHASPNQIAFLRYVVAQTQAGNADRIKAYTVATEVFGRPADFDPSNDPIVSIQAARLRAALKNYYAKAGQHDSIRIDLPKGTYVPVFENRLYAQTADTAIVGDYPVAGVKRSWPSVLVRPLRNLSGDPELDFWGIGLATELADELNRYPDIRVMTLSSVNANTQADPRAAQFVIDGSVRSDGTFIKMIVQLTDNQSGIQIWSESRRSSIEAAKLIAFQEELAGEIATKVAGERGWIMKTLDKASKRHAPYHSAVYEAILRQSEYNLTMTPGAFSRALAALQKAVTLEPDCGATWSMLARLFANIYAFDIPGFQDPLEKAFEFAQNGIRLLPEDQRSRGILAYVHLLRNDLTAGRGEAERALKLGPRTLFVLDGIGFLMTLLGDWERGPALIEKVIRLNPFYANHVHYALWVNCLRQKNFAEAFHETLKLNRPALFWDHIASASTYGLLGNIEGGRKSAGELLKLKPDFAERGRILIEHYIKFEDIAERVIKGLNVMGIKVR